MQVVMNNGRKMVAVIVGIDKTVMIYIAWFCGAGSSTFHNLTVRGAGVPAVYDGYVGNFLPAHTHSDANEATSSSTEVSYISSWVVHNQGWNYPKWEI